MNQNWIDDYISARNNIIIRNSDFIIQEELRVMKLLVERIASKYINIKNDFDNAHVTKKYWDIYAPIQRGYKPRNEAYPWGEVGEKVIEGHLYSSLNELFEDIRFPGIPYGHDLRFSTSSSFVHLDVKSTGPTDNHNEVVSSPNQVTGNGLIGQDGRIYNEEVNMSGLRITRKFRPELAPFYLIDNKIIPVLTYYVKVVYDVISPGEQPLKYIELICVPNGIPMFVSPNYNNLYPGILTPGKDEVGVLRKRTRIKLTPLASIDNWRCQKIYLDDSNRVAISTRY